MVGAFATLVNVGKVGIESSGAESKTASDVLGGLVKCVARNCSGGPHCLTARRSLFLNRRRLVAVAGTKAELRSHPVLGAKTKDVGTLVVTLYIGSDIGVFISIDIRKFHCLGSSVFIVKTENTLTADDTSNTHHHTPRCAHVIVVPALISVIGHRIVLACRCVLGKTAVARSVSVVHRCIVGIGHLIPCGSVYGESYTQLIDGLEYQSELHIESCTGRVQIVVKAIVSLASCLIVGVGTVCSVGRLRCYVCIIEVFVIVAYLGEVDVGYTETKTPIQRIVNVTSKVYGILVDVTLLPYGVGCTAGCAVTHQSLEVVSARIGIYHESLIRKDAKPGSITVDIGIVILAARQVIGIPALAVGSCGHQVTQRGIKRAESAAIHAIHRNGA